MSGLLTSPTLRMIGRALREALQMSSGKSAALDDWDGITFTWAPKAMQVVMDLADTAGLSMQFCGAIKEMVKEARHVKA